MKPTNRTVTAEVEVSDADLVDLCRQADPLVRVFALRALAGGFTEEDAVKFAELTGPQPVQDLALHVEIFAGLLQHGANQVQHEADHQLDDEHKALLQEAKVYWLPDQES